jgi:UDP-N-acetylglucosamine 2-epimerase (non-hydrolysing)/GDP/UDP-N,N'-diacetylbacillosamine 2-epimerase (hydrolysing)
VKNHSRKRKIAAVTTSRSDYAHLRWLLHDLSKHPQVDLQVIAMGPHLSPEFGSTVTEISKDARAVTQLECLLSSDSDVGMAKTLGLATLGLADTLGHMRPDLMLLIADRYEMLAPASVALTLRIPIAHIEGGETTAGAIDDAVRNAITKMSHLHFACTRTAKQRLIAMGEQPWRVTYSGSLSIDNLRRSRLAGKRKIEKQLGISLDGQRQTILALYHPVTLMKDTVQEATETFAALAKSKQQILFIYPNADAGSRQLIAMAERFVARSPRSKLLVNLDHTAYLGLLRNVDLLIGNSSSGVIESTSLGIPALNIGIRQQGREHAANVLDVPARRQEIREAIRHALSPDFRQSVQDLENPYGNGRASQIITEVLTSTPLGADLLFKT